MTGKPRGRGVMGETPLHLAVLFNNGTEHDRIMHALWDKYVDLRTARQFSSAPVSCVCVRVCFSIVGFGVMHGIREVQTKQRKEDKHNPSA